MEVELETALHFAAEASDIESLKALARQESARADRLAHLLCAVLRANGMTTIPADSLNQNRNADGFVIAEQPDGSYCIRAGTPANPTP